MANDEVESIVSASGEPASPSPLPEASPDDLLRIPPLGIIHFMAWTAMAAVFFSVSFASRGPAVFDLETLLEVITQVVLAAQTVGLVILIRAGALTRLKQIGPGHALLLVGGPVALFWNAATTFVATSPQVTSYYVTRIDVMAVFLTGAYRSFSRKLGRGGLTTLGLAVYTSIVSTAFYPPQMAFRLIFEVTLLLGLAGLELLKRRRRWPRDWVDDLGILSLAILAIVDIAWQISCLFAPG